MTSEKQINTFKFVEDDADQKPLTEADIIRHVKETFKKTDDLRKYFVENGYYLPVKQYVYNVLNSLKPDFCRQNFQEAIKKRINEHSAKEGEQKVKVSE